MPDTIRRVVFQRYQVKVWSPDDTSISIGPTLILTPISLSVDRYISIEAGQSLFKQGAMVGIKTSLDNRCLQCYNKLNTGGYNLNVPAIQFFTDYTASEFSIDIKTVLE